MSSDPGPASSGFPQPSDSPADPMPPTEPIQSTWPIPPTPAAPPPLPPTRRLPASPPPAPARWPAPPPPAPAPPAPPQARPGYGPPTYGGAPYGPQGPVAYPYGPQGRYLHAGMLAAAADRERTMDVLKAAFTEGRLTKGEFDDRTARVLSARTYADLNALVADLPVGPGGPPLAPAPYQGGYYQALTVRGTNGFAVGSLVCAVLLPFFGIPAVILGHIAREQIRKTGERGDGMAIAGLIIGYLTLSVWALIILISIANH